MEYYTNKAEPIANYAPGAMPVYSKSASHLFTCNQDDAKGQCLHRLCEALTSLEQVNTLAQIIYAFEEQLSLLLNTLHKHRYQQQQEIPSHIEGEISEAVHHQNIIGWHQAL